MSDLIKREDAIEVLQKEIVFETANAIPYEDYDSGCIGGLKKAIRTIEKLPTADNWIPVSERLPKDGQGVFVTVDDNEYDIKVGSCVYSDGCFRSVLYELNVIAWMSLPTPYKGGDSE